MYYCSAVRHTLPVLARVRLASGSRTRSVSLLVSLALALSLSLSSHSLTLSSSRASLSVTLYDSKGTLSPTHTTPTRPPRTRTDVPHPFDLVLQRAPSQHTLTSLWPPCTLSHTLYDRIDAYSTHPHPARRSPRPNFCRVFVCSLTSQLPTPRHTLTLSPTAYHRARSVYLVYVNHHADEDRRLRRLCSRPRRPRLGADHQHPDRPLHLRALPALCVTTLPTYLSRHVRRESAASGPFSVATCPSR